LTEENAKMRFRSVCASAAKAEKMIVAKASQRSGAASSCMRCGNNGTSNRRNP